MPGACLILRRTAGAEGDRPGINDKGLVTADRKVRKDAFYYYKANWSDAPFVYITSRRFNPRPPGATIVKVYSNCDFVELFLNGHSLGGRSGIDHVFVWPNVQLGDGKAKARRRQSGRQGIHRRLHVDGFRARTGDCAINSRAIHGLFDMFHKMVHH